VSARKEANASQENVNASSLFLEWLASMRSVHINAGRTVPVIIPQESANV